MSGPVTVAVLRHGGSHLIRPLVKRVGRRPIVEPGTHGAPADRAEGPVIVLVRDPRNRIVSEVRWQADKSGCALRREGADTVIAALIRRPATMPAMLEWARRWTNWPGAMVLQYEEFATAESGVRAIAAIATFLGVVEPDPAARYRWIWRTSRTVQAEPSDWRTWFGPAAREAWAACGGPELQKVMGYE